MLGQKPVNCKIRILPPPNGGSFGGGLAFSVAQRLKEIFTNRLRWVKITMILDHRKIFKTYRIFYARGIFYDCPRAAKNHHFWPISETYFSHVRFWDRKWSKGPIKEIWATLECFWQIPTKIFNFFGVLRFFWGIYCPPKTYFPLFQCSQKCVII